jgi:hypothetical protein
MGVLIIIGVVLIIGTLDNLFCKNNQLINFFQKLIFMYFIFAFARAIYTFIMNFLEIKRNS